MDLFPDCPALSFLILCSSCFPPALVLFLLNFHNVVILPGMKIMDDLTKTSIYNATDEELNELIRDFLHGSARDAAIQEQQRRLLLRTSNARFIDYCILAAAVIGDIFALILLLKK
jgi:hypothetical protein